MAGNQVTSPKSILSTNSIDSIQQQHQQNPSLLSPPCSNNNNNNILSPSSSLDHQISSPQNSITQTPSLSANSSRSSLLQSQQQQQINPNVLQQQQQQQQQQLNQQQQQNLMSQKNFSQMQRSPSMSRMSQLHQQQQQQTYGMATGTMLQQTGIYGQMNFGAASNLQQQQQQQQMVSGGGGLSRSGLIGQVSGQLPMLPGQAAANAQYNIQSQMMPRQKTNLAQGSQFLAGNNSAQTLQGFQSLGVMGIGQLGQNGSVAYAHRLKQAQAQVQMRQQQLPQQTSLTSPQGLQRQSSIAALNPQLAGLTQNVQPAMLTQQQWFKQIQQPISSPGSPSFQLQQQQTYLPQQLASSPQLHPKSMTMNQQQQSQLVKQQPQLVNQQSQLHQHPQYQQQQQQQHQQQQQQQQQSLRMPGSTVQKSFSLTGSQPDTPASGTTTPGGSSSHGTETNNQLLGKRKIQDLVSQVDSQGKLDSEVEDLLLEIADDFIDSVTTFACSIAKHRKSATLESKDLLLHLEKNWHLTIPGLTSEELKHSKRPLSGDLHKKRLEMIRALMESSQHPENTRMVNAKDTMKQGFMHPVGVNHQHRTPTNSEQLISSLAGSSMLQQLPRF